MATLTTTDIAAIKGADDICVHLNSNHPTGLVRLIKRKPYGKPFAEDQEHILTATATLETPRAREALAAGQASCFAMSGIYHSQHAPVSSVLKTLRVGDEVSFRFYPDGHTNVYVARAGLHADLLYLDVRRDGRLVKSWEFDVSVCPDNSARMCKGVPNSDSYNRDAARAEA